MFEATKLKTISLIPVFVLSLIVLFSASPAWCTNVEKARACLEAYVKALQRGSEEQARAFWNREELARYQVYDWQWGSLVFRKLNPGLLSYRILGAEDKGDFVVLEVEWYYHEGKAGPLQTDHRYFIDEQGKTVGANPILVYTRDWPRKESRHFVYHYRAPQEEPDLVLLDEMDRFYDRVVDFLYLEYADRIDYYRCDSVEQVGLFFDAEGSLARSNPYARVIASVRKSAPHEVVHVISYAILPLGGQVIPPEYLSEGLAYYLGGASFFSPELLMSWAKQKMAREGSIPLDSLILAPWSRGVNLGAGLVSSFAKLLIDTRGIRRFKELFSAGPGLDEQRQALKTILRASEDEVRQEWELFVLGTAVPEITVEEPINCKTAYDVRDERKDDKGDGDYVYPRNEKTSPGMFDLTEARLSLDKDLVYFQLYFSDLSHAEISSEEGFNGTFAAVVIDTDNVEHSGNTRLFFDNGNFELADRDGYEFALEVSNAGVLVYDQDWIWQAEFLKALSLDNHVRGSEMFFAVPWQIIGVPKESWKIQVLTGGQSGGWRTAGYGVGRFMKVGQSPSADQGGGGTDTEFGPDIYDILTPEGTDQSEILGSYDIGKGKKVVVPMVPLGGK